MEWDKWGLFISLVTPLILGIGAWINDAVTKRKNKGKDPKVLQGLPVDYESDYINLLKRNLADARKEIIDLKRELKEERKKP
jgi:hypothetical protein